jgi:SPP1 gp7 family putative phage head morphogenesis protein
MQSAFEEGKSLKELRKDIQQLGDQFNQVRAEAIARTETVRAANQGARLGYRQAGVEKLRYSAVLDSATSEICQHLNGKVVSINEGFWEEDSFTLESGKRLDLSYDNGVPEPPAHPNCRSTIIPVFE